MRHCSIRVNESQMGFGEYGHLNAHPSPASSSHFYLAFLHFSPLSWYFALLAFSLSQSQYSVVPTVNSGRLNQHIQSDIPAFERWSTFPIRRRKPGYFIKQIIFPHCNLPLDSNWISLWFCLFKTLGVGWFLVVYSTNYTLLEAWFITGMPDARYWPLELMFKFLPCLPLTQLLNEPERKYF